MEWKIKYITDYFSTIFFWKEFWSVIGIGFFSLLLTFALLFVSRCLTDFYYKIIEPFAVTKIDKKQIFTYNDKKILEERIIKLESKISTQNDSLEKEERINESLRQKIIDTEADLNDKINSKTDEAAENLANYERLLEDNSNNRLIFEQYNDLYNSITGKELLVKIERGELINANETSISIAKDILDLVNAGFITLNIEKKIYELTKLGMFFQKVYPIVSKRSEW
jgi:uncharacterized coiled-coil protein SlyX